MNYLPFAGYWFYGATSDNERANYFGSWGLLADAPAGTPATTSWFREKWISAISRLSAMIGPVQTMITPQMIN